MAKFKTNGKDYSVIKVKGKNVRVIKKDRFNSFNSDVLGLGQLGMESNQKQAISVMFDLEGFTNFCKQIDPQLAVPEYLNEFLNWLFNQIREELMHQEHVQGYETYAELPFLAKFMGDGVLFLWDTEGMDEETILNIIVSISEICTVYETDFYPEIRKKVAAPPTRLRCGIARGTIYSVGNGNDYVGPCINMSARLQKLHSLSLCFSRRGLNPEVNDDINDFFQTMKVKIRGIGDDELVCVLKHEYETLSEEEKTMFEEV